MMPSPLFAPLFSEDVIAHQFSDEQLISYLLTVEVALAKVQAAAGVIPAEAAAQIEKAAQSLTVNWAALQAGTDKSGVPVIALVKQLRETVGAEYGDWVHWGATSQDVMDTALVLQLKNSIAHLENLLAQTIQHLAQMANMHRHTLMAGRTHSQQALPITFGFKVAGWLAPLLRHQERLSELKPRLFVVQFGGAVGTLAALGQRGTAIQRALAAELNLNMPLMAWHTQRDSIVELANWLALVTGSLGKMAQDIILMAQSEVAEVLESDDVTRGGSSTMPQKRNPIVSEMIVVAARHNANLLATMHQAMLQEHERAAGSWQLEWLALPQMLTLTGSALQKAHFLSRNLQVDAARMRANAEASCGLMLAEAIEFALRERIGRQESQKIIKEAVAVALAEQRHLADIVREKTPLDLDWAALRDAATYTGAANNFIDHIVSRVEST